MSSFQGTFKRYEKKYLLDDAQYKQLIERLRGKLCIDGYGKTKICNIYFDTPNHYLIRTSLEKPIYKEKLRIRSYGTPVRNDMVFVELKKKYKGIVYKRREKMRLSTLEPYLYDSKPLRVQNQIIKEIDYFLKFHKDISPAMYISYERVAMYGLQDRDIRITFDSNIIWRDEDLYLESGDRGNSLLNDNVRIMEIKLPGVMPLWLAHILNDLAIYPSSFSKYGQCYMQSISKTNNKQVKGVIKYA